MVDDMSNAFQFGPAPTSAAAAANAFLDFARAEPQFPAVTQMKLQKLLFYAHAWHLAIKDAPLFDEDFEAWPWGPVVRDVYTQTAQFGREPVTTAVTKLERVGEGPFAYRFRVPEQPDSETMAFLRSVWNAHKGYTGVQLSNSTHAPSEPWTIVKEQAGSLNTKPTIPNELIATVFKAKLPKNDAAADSAAT